MKEMQHVQKTNNYKRREYSKLQFMLMCWYADIHLLSLFSHDINIMKIHMELKILCI